MDVADILEVTKMEPTSNKKIPKAIFIVFLIILEDVDAKAKKYGEDRILETLQEAYK